MSKNSITARHRATPARSIALQGLAVSAKSLGRPALAVAAASGIAFGVGAPAHAGVTGPDTTETTNTQAYAAPAAAVAAPAAAAANVHTVVSGDTLGGISAAYGVSLNDVLSANGLAITAIIYPGDQIQIPGAGQVAAAPAAAPAPAPVQAAVAAAPANTGVNVSYASAPAAATGSGAGAAILASAYGQVGVQQDCTAMVEKALRSVGKSVGDLAPGQFFQYGSVVGTPAAGDLVITAGHVGVYAGNGQVVSGGVDGFKTEVHSISWLSGASFVRVA
ncbi:MAG: peptidoglycan-binding protein LysM [Pseudarthrobacter sp.]|nr:peptidoglycan-binding protein LysM [Pseudarthrobacter sp.]